MKKNVAVIMGGYTQEHEVSIRSGRVVCTYLPKDKYNIYPVHISKSQWVYVGADGEETAVNKQDFSLLVGGKRVAIDVVFNAIHGTPGEDGKLQAYFEVIGMPHTSCGHYQSALTFNKRDLLAVLKPHGIKTARSYYLDKGQAIDTDGIVRAVGLPCFVKANRSGSSFGVYKAYTEEELSTSIEKAFGVDSEIIIESFLDGIEVSVGVIFYKGKIEVLPITEIVSENDFFDYEAKYLGKSKEITPARLSETQENNVKDAALRVYKVLKMKGFSRSEFIFVGDEPFFLEMNTVPGLTTESILPQQAKAFGISLEQLFSNAVEEAINAT